MAAKTTHIVEKAKKIIDVLIEAGTIRYGHMPEKKVEEKCPEASIQESPNAATQDSPKIISGVQGLADYLGCSKGTAMKIVKSGILPSGEVQYKVGENWKFNREQLDNFIAKNPEILGRKKPREQ